VTRIKTEECQDISSKSAIHIDQSQVVNPRHIREIRVRFLFSLITYGRILQ
jgi:hypothetical protein